MARRKKSPETIKCTQGRCCVYKKGSDGKPTGKALRCFTKRKR